MNARARTQPVIKAGRKREQDEEAFFLSRPKLELNLQVMVVQRLFIFCVELQLAIALVLKNCWFVASTYVRTCVFPFLAEFLVLKNKTRSSLSVCLSVCLSASLGKSVTHFNAISPVLARTEHTAEKY